MCGWFRVCRGAFVADAHPSSSQLEVMNLRPGANIITFEVMRGVFHGSETVSCKLYLWTPDTKVVISDVDGTITKSDILGHLMYYVGRDWTQAGVARLYTKIKVLSTVGVPDVVTCHYVVAFLCSVVGGGVVVTCTLLCVVAAVTAAEWLRDRVPHIAVDRPNGLHEDVPPGIVAVRCGERSSEKEEEGGVED